MVLYANNILVTVYIYFLLLKCILGMVWGITTVAIGKQWTQEEPGDNQKRRKNMAILKWNCMRVPPFRDRLSEVISFLTFLSKLIFCISLMSVIALSVLQRGNVSMQHKGHRHKSGFSEECRNEEMPTHSQSDGFELQIRMVRLLRGMLRLIFSRCQPIHT